ncbi:MAG: S-layer homology domain-containing protein [Candidatus Limnocylindria bacterium]
MPVRTPIALFVLALFAGSFLSTLPAPARAATQKVVVIVGPTGPITDSYRQRGDDIAAAAAAVGATVEKVYSPNATWQNVRTAVDGANVIVYLGHGNGSPNPYTPNVEMTDRVNGWGLNRIAGIDSADPTGDGDNWGTNMVYCGEKALLGTLGPGDGAAQQTYCAGGPITPAPNFTMIYSNACYAPGAGESRPAAPEATAVSRVANYSSPILELGGTYIATDLGADTVVDLVLRNSTTAFGRIFELGNGFDASALRRFAHADVAGSEVWVQKTTEGRLGDDYWYAFAGVPGRTPSGATVSYAPPVDVGVSFSDISDSAFQTDIIWLAESGVTSGCGNGRFCPKASVTREQMASFLVRALDLPETSTDFFADDDSSAHEADINRLAASGITGGCAEGRFCPGGNVNREQMASFLARALDLPAATVDSFADDDDSPHENDINRLASSGITGGCGTDLYCPAAAVVREQMAAFLHRALME